jgi:hypothetical protein
VGLMPDKELKPEEDWVEAAKRFVEHYDYSLTFNQYLPDI